MKASEIRKQGEDFISELGKYYYKRGTGKVIKESLKEVYLRYNHIFTYENIKQINTNGENCTSKEKRALLSFLIQGFIGNKIQSLTQEIVKTELETSVIINKRPISLRYAMLLLSAEKDRNERLKLDVRLGQMQDKLNPLREKRVSELKQIATDLGYSSYIQLIEDITNINLKQMKLMAQQFLVCTEEKYKGILEKLEGYYLTKEDKPLVKSDITYIFKSNPFDKFFSEIELIPTIEDTLFAMGINIHEQPNINLSFERQEGKAPKAFCCPVSIPEEIHLVFNPKGGIEDYQNSLHETGHSQHYAYTDKELPFEFKRLGDKSVGEGYAFLFQQLTSNSMWIEKFLDMDINDSEQYKAFISGYNLYILRRFCGKLLYELEIFSGSLLDSDLRAKYVELMEKAVMVKVNPSNYLIDLDLGFNTPYYLKAWILESYLRDFLENANGTDWFSCKESGDVLKELWKKGQQFSAEELVEHLGYSGFNMNLLEKQFNNN